MLVDHVAAVVGGTPPAEYRHALEASRRGDPAAVEELLAIWRGARDEAAIAYRRWCRTLGGDAYTAYRAAADRADVAQEVLTAVLGTDHRRPSSPG